jgi:hypothetical protein
MKMLNFILAGMLVLLASLSQAQTTTTKPAFTDEDLKKYAITMDSVKGMQLTLQEIITEMVQKNTVMSVQRYNELYKVAGDEAKLTEKNATAEEKKFLKDVSDKRTEEMARVNATYQGLVKEYVGVKTFNAIKKSLETDQQLKAKYETMTKELESKGGE